MPRRISKLSSRIGFRGWPNSSAERFVASLFALVFRLLDLSAKSQRILNWRKALLLLLIRTVEREREKVDRSSIVASWLYPPLPSDSPDTSIHDDIADDDDRVYNM